MVLGLVALFADCDSACERFMNPGSQQELTKQALLASAAVSSGEVLDVERQAATETHPGTAAVAFRGAEA
jgi:hypothetical protein